MATAVPAGAVPRHMTLGEFEDYPWNVEGKLELVRGEVRVTPPPGFAHARVVRNIFRALDAYVFANRLGEVFGDGAGYALLQLPNTYRMPDVSYVRAGRLPELAPLRGAARLAPDLTVEVLSPSESWSDTNEKLEDAFAAGTAAAWVVDPRRWQVTVFTPDWGRRVVGEGELLDGAPVLPEFAMPVADVFAGVERPN